MKLEHTCSIKCSHGIIRLFIQRHSHRLDLLFYLSSHMASTPSSARSSVPRHEPQAAESRSNYSHEHVSPPVCSGLRVASISSADDAKAAAFNALCRVVDTPFSLITPDYLLRLYAGAAAAGNSQASIEFVAQIDQGMDQGKRGSSGVGCCIEVL